MMRPLASVEESIADVELVFGTVICQLERARWVWFEPNINVIENLGFVVEQGDAHKIYSLDHVQQRELIHDPVQEFLRHRCTKVHEDKGVVSPKHATYTPELAANSFTLLVSHSED